jgi:hypothetical protein
MKKIEDSPLKNQADGQPSHASAWLLLDYSICTIRDHYW